MAALSLGVGGRDGTSSPCVSSMLLRLKDGMSGDIASYLAVSYQDPASTISYLEHDVFLPLLP